MDGVAPAPEAPLPAADVEEVVAPPVLTGAEGEKIGVEICAMAPKAANARPLLKKR